MRLRLCGMFLVIGCRQRGMRSWIETDTWVSQTENGGCVGFAALRTKEHCQNKGIWCAELGANDIFVLWQHRFVIGEEAFSRETWAGIEEHVKRKLAEKKQIEEMAEGITEERLASVKEMFRAGQEGEQAMIGPEEMRDMAEESVERVKTTEN